MTKYAPDERPSWLKSWNFRVIRHRNDIAERIPAITQAEVIEAGEEFYFEIHECHYEKKSDTVPDSYSPPCTVGSTTMEGMAWQLLHMSAAWCKPILEIVDGKLREVAS